jgi:ATP-binding cassette subfamily C protein/ATP-binding cassette subfamily C protein EexD
MSTETNASPLARAVRAYRPVLVATAVFSMAINLLLFTGPLYMIQIYDRVLTSRSLGTLVALSALAAGALVVYGLIEWIRSRILVRAGIVFDTAVARPLFARLISRDGATHQPRAMQALRDLDALREFLTGTAPVIFCDAPWTPLFVVLAWAMHPALGVAAIVGILGLVVLAVATDRVSRPVLDAAGAEARAAAAFAVTATGNRDVVVAMGMAGRFTARWAARHDRVLALQTRASDQAGLLVAATKTYRLILQSGVLGLGAWLVIDGEIGAGAMLAASLLLGRALAPVEQAAQHWRAFVAARDLHARLAAVLADADIAAEPMDLPAPQGRLDVEGITVRAPRSGRVLLSGVSFSVAAGEVLVVLGSSGAGKSTLMRTLVDAWRPAGGCIRLDGATLDRWGAERLGAAVGYLPQDIELFAGTVAENIARFGDIDAAAVVEAARAAGVHEMILRLPEGYDTDIGPGGEALSGGQRQRLALTRALYGRPALVVLDEPNSNLDAGGEAALADAVRTLKAAGSTVILSSHRPALIDLADSVLVLADGARRLHGPRDEVMARLAPRPARAA